MQIIVLKVDEIHAHLYKVEVVRIAASLALLVYLKAWRTKLGSG